MTIFHKSLTHFQCFTACVTIGTLHVVDRPLPKFHTGPWSTTPDCEINFKRKIRRTDTGAVRHPSAKAFPPHYADPPEKGFPVPHIPNRKLREASPLRNILQSSALILLHRQAVGEKSVRNGMMKAMDRQVWSRRSLIRRAGFTPLPARRRRREHSHAAPSIKRYQEARDSAFGIAGKSTPKRRKARKTPLYWSCPGIWFCFRDMSFWQRG